MSQVPMTHSAIWGLESLLVQSFPNGSTHPSTKHVRVGPIGGAEGDIGVFVEVVGDPPVGSGRHELDISDFGQLFGRVRHEPDQQSNSVVHLIR